MTKADLEALVLKEAALARTEMIERRGTYEQRALLIDGRGRSHLLVIGGAPLHGAIMAGVLRAYAAGLPGGADAILILSDARGETTAEADVARREEIAAAARRGEWIIADNPENPELIITGGRSREHSVALFDRYRREPGPEGDRITFEAPAPAFNPDYRRVEIPLIPDIWGRVN